MPKFHVGSLVGNGALIGLGLVNACMECLDGLGQVVDGLSLGAADCLDDDTHARTHDLEELEWMAGVLGSLEFS